MELGVYRTYSADASKRRAESKCYVVTWIMVHFFRVCPDALGVASQAGVRFDFPIQMTTAPIVYTFQSALG
ncbi:hypothetical protein Prudu_001316 [Prunus dulcis]|uniref:Uncharacterized protein n=1 Tax=Prunus dulcis TaxID=3755 RepID=A0A4Y1QNG6_PRUDU|nr:hypothetical protein Prudu_001316 [Prunus dulcis]